MRYIVIEGKRYRWRDILTLRREQHKAERQPEPALFELREDRRPESQRRADRRFAEPTLFEL